jgi:monoamine oxidase
MATPKYFEYYELNERRTTTGRTITETDIVIHAGHTGDFFPHHMDAEWCKTQPFGQRIAHGTLVFSVAVGMTADVVNPVAFSYGYDRLRFVRPVHIGDTIHVTLMIAEKREDPKRPGYGFVHEQGAVFNQRDETVLVFTHIHSVERSP